MIDRIDLAEKTLATMRQVEEDSCLIPLAECWLNLHNPKVPVNCYESMIKSLNELSEKFGYTVKTYNILGIILMIQGEIEKAQAIFENALVEMNAYNLQDGDPLLAPSNYELQSLIYNYIKCNAMLCAPQSMSHESYSAAGL
jgi:tetratricopeptide (TPR) repeat protein